MRNYSTETIRAYTNAVKHFAEYFRESPEKLGPEHIRQYQLHLFQRKLAAHSIKVQSWALRFLYIHTLRRPYMLEHIPIPKTPVKLPNILSREEAARLIEGAPNLMYRAIIMTLYSTGLRRSEACQLQEIIRGAIARLCARIILCMPNSTLDRSTADSIAPG